MSTKSPREIFFKKRTLGQEDAQDQVRAELLKSANGKLAFASQTGLRESSDKAVAQLARTRASNGVIRVFSDSGSRWVAHHFNEECVVRFKAGSEYGREDRAAINSRQYSEYSSTQILELVASGRFDSSKDTLLVFASDPYSGDLERFIVAAKSKNFPVILAAPETYSGLLSKTDFSFSLPTESKAILSSLQTVFLHALCESFEPEYNAENDNLPACFERSAELDRSIASDQAMLSLIVKTGAAFSQRINLDATVFVAGNGGSACEANSWAEHARGLRNTESKPFEVVELHAADTLLCAYNDNHAPFARQIDANGQAGDIFLIYSTSGNSQNIIDAVNLAKSRGILVIGLLGKGGGKLSALCDYSIVVPSKETSRIQEAHALLGPSLLEN